MATILDESAIEKELTNFLRSNITDPNNRGTSDEELFSGDNSETDFVITESNVKALTSVEYPIGTTLTYGDDYTYEPTTQTVTFTTAPATGTDNVELSYKYGETWIYEDFNKTNLVLSDFPRVAANIISSSSEPIAIGGKRYNSSILYSVTVAGKTKEQIKTVLKEIRTDLLNNNKSFYNFTIIEPSAGSAFGNSNLHDRIIQKTQDYIIPFNFEVAD